MKVVVSAQTKSKYPSLIIAASNAPTRIKDVANYVCDGTSDEAQITEAITSLTTGGSILLSEGTFNISDNISMLSNISLNGTGYATILKLADDINKNIIMGTNLSNIQIQNLQIDGNKANNSYQNDEDSQNGILVQEWYNSLINNILIQNCVSDGIRLIPETGTSSSQNQASILSNIISKSNAKNGISFGTWLEYTNIINSHFISNTENGVKLESANINFDNCQMVSNTESGIRLNSSDKTTNNSFSNCKINHNTEHGIYSNGAIGLNISNSDIIANGYHGAYIYGGEQVKITGGTLNTNCYANTDYDQICLDNSATSCIINGNTMMKGSGAARYGINEISGAGNIYALNRIGTHGTGAISSVAGSSVNQHNIA